MNFLHICRINFTEVSQFEEKRNSCNFHSVLILPVRFSPSMNLFLLKWAKFILNGLGTIRTCWLVRDNSVKNDPLLSITYFSGRSHICSRRLARISFYDLPHNAVIKNKRRRSLRRNFRSWPRWLSRQAAPSFSAGV